MSSLWDVVIWSGHVDELMPELKRFADNREWSAAFIRPPFDGVRMGNVDIVTGQVSHLDPDDLLRVVKAVHAADGFLYPATVLMSNEYDMGALPRVYQLGDNGEWQ